MLKRLPVYCYDPPAATATQRLSALSDEPQTDDSCLFSEQGPAQPDLQSRKPATTRTGSERRRRKRFAGVRLDQAEWTQLETRASNSGLTVGAFLRACALETAGPRARRRAPIDRELLARTNADLNRIGNNLDQIARALNPGENAAPDEIADTHDELRAALTLLRQACGYDRQG